MTISVIKIPTSGPANGIAPSPTGGPAEVAAAARLVNDDTLPTTNDDRFDNDRESSGKTDDDDFSVRHNISK